MEPQNKKERSILFRRFLLVFVVGILLVMIPFYFTIKLPERENSQTSEELHTLQQQVDLQKDFAVRIDTLLHLFDGYDSKNVDIDKLKADIGFILSEMETSIAADTSWMNRMDNDMILTFLELKKAKDSLKELEMELAKCRRSLNAKVRSRPSHTLD